MKNKKAEEVIKKLKEENETFTIEVIGDRENEINAFSILINCKEPFGSFGKKNNYGPISKKTIALLNEAEIKYKIIE